MYYLKDEGGDWQAFFRRLKRLLIPPVSDFSKHDFSSDKKANRYITREEIDERLRRCGEYAQKYGD